MRVDDSEFTKAGGKVVIPLDDWALCSSGAAFRYTVVAKQNVVEYGTTKDWNKIVKSMERVVVQIGATRLMEPTRGSRVYA